MFRLAVIAICLLIAPSKARAVDAGDVINGILGIIQGVEQYQRNKALEKELKPHVRQCEQGVVASCDHLLKYPLNDRARAAILQTRQRAVLYHRFAGNWDLCFGKNNVSACNAALTYPYAAQSDLVKLTAHRTTLLEAERKAQAERLRREEERRAQTVRLREEAERERRAREARQAPRETRVASRSVVSSSKPKRASSFDPMSVTMFLVVMGLVGLASYQVYLFYRRRAAAQVDDGAFRQAAEEPPREKPRARHYTRDFATDIRSVLYD